MKILKNKKVKKIADYFERKRSSKNPLLRGALKTKDFIDKKYYETIPYPIVLENKKTIFMPIDKVANTSLRQTLRKIDDKRHAIQKSKTRKYKDYFKFAFVRNPYDRLVSCYTNKISGKSEMFLKHNKKFKTEISFKEFVRVVSSIPNKKLDRHLKPQYLFLTDKKGNLIPDFIGKFENINEDFKKACKKAGIENPPELPKKNPSKRKKDYKDYYDEETKKLVQERYRKDFELFGYSKEF
jgi:chondroitin 4-sulfotransferase 11